MKTSTLLWLAAGGIGLYLLTRKQATLRGLGDDGVDGDALAAWEMVGEALTYAAAANAAIEHYKLGAVVANIKRNGNDSWPDLNAPDGWSAQNETAISTAFCICNFLRTRILDMYARRSAIANLEAKSAAGSVGGLTKASLDAIVVKVKEQFVGKPLGEVWTAIIGGAGKYRPGAMISGIMLLIDTIPNIKPFIAALPSIAYPKGKAAFGSAFKRGVARAKKALAEVKQFKECDYKEPEDQQVPPGEQSFVVTEASPTDIPSEVMPVLGTKTQPHCLPKTWVRQLPGGDALWVYSQCQLDSPPSAKGRYIDWGPAVTPPTSSPICQDSHGNPQPYFHYMGHYYSLGSEECVGMAKGTTSLAPRSVSSRGRRASPLRRALRGLDLL